MAVLKGLMNLFREGLMNLFREGLMNLFREGSSPKISELLLTQHTLFPDRGRASFLISTQMEICRVSI